MKLSKYFFLSLIAVGVFFGSHSVFAAGNIDTVEKYSQFIDIDLDTNGTDDFINWNPTNGGATVTDAAVTGTIWGETVGWINLNPTNGGVTNTCSGVLGGYAWGQNTGWINFAPTNAIGANQPKINTTTGAITGTVWSQNYGWIQLSSPDATYSGLITTWNGCAGEEEEEEDDSDDPEGNLDLCTNIPLYQPTVPNGYYKDTPGDTPGNCYLINTPDVCPNLPGIQIGVPTGYQLVGGICVLINPQTIDLCPNINGTQQTVPSGHIIDINGNCVKPPTTYDECPNINGNQPQGTICDNEQVYICSDGLDNDNDGRADFPSDPGCVSPVDNSEENPVVPPVDPTGPDSVDSGSADPKTFVKGFSNILALLAALMSVVGIASTIPGFVTRIANLVLSIPFYRRRCPWGIVYDAETKEPIDPAYVVVYNADTNQVVDTKITDINGRYGFLLPVGNYRIVAQKTHYQFPTQKILHQQTDGVYDNLYFGEVFTVADTKRDTVITLNIPMDRLAGDWNQEEKKRMGLFSFLTRNTKLWERISLFLFVIGFVFAIYALIVSSNTWNTLIFALYVVLTVLQLIGFGPTSIGTITDRSGNPIPFAVIRVWSAHLGTQITQRVANAQGQYYLLVTNGDYYVTVDVKNPSRLADDGSLGEAGASGAYDRVYTSETIKVHQGIVNKDFKVS